MKQLVHEAHEGNERSSSLVIFAERLTSPYNVGSLFRLADALGVDQLYFGGDTPLPPNRKINKTSRSTERSVAFEHVQDSTQFLAELAKQEFELIALELCDESVSLRELIIDKNRPVCLILGEEQSGVSQESLDAADKVVHIPMHGKNSSMNVIQACAIAAYNIINQ